MLSTNPKPIIYLIRIIYPDPLDPLGVKTYHILGVNFGTQEGTVTVEPTGRAPFKTVANVISWTNNKVVLTLNNPPRIGVAEVKLFTSDGIKAESRYRSADILKAKNDPVWDLLETYVDDNVLHFLGTKMDIIQSIILVENISEEEFVVFPSSALATDLSVLIPSGSTNSFYKAHLIGETGNSEQDVLASVWDRNKLEPGFDGWKIVAPTDRVGGRGLKFSNVSSEIGQVILTDSNANTLFRGVASPFDSSHLTSPFVQAHFTSASQNELVVRWPKTILPLIVPATYLEPLVKVELNDFVNPLVTFIPEIGEDPWSYDPELTNVTYSALADKVTLTGKHFEGLWNLNFTTEPIGGGAQSTIYVSGVGTHRDITDSICPALSSITDSEIVSVEAYKWLGGQNLLPPQEIVRVRGYVVTDSVTPVIDLDLSLTPVEVPFTPPTLPVVTGATKVGTSELNITGTNLLQVQTGPFDASIGLGGAISFDFNNSRVLEWTNTLIRIDMSPNPHILVNSIDLYTLFCSVVTTAVVPALSFL